MTFQVSKGVHTPGDPLDQPRPEDIPCIKKLKEEAIKRQQTMDAIIKKNDFVLAKEKLELLHEIATSRVYDEANELSLYNDLKLFLESHCKEG